MCRRRFGALSVRSSRVVLAVPRLAVKLRRCSKGVCEATVTKHVAVRWGEHEAAVQTIAQGRPECSCLYLWSSRSRTFCCARARGCSCRHPVFPAPSSQRRGTKMTQTSGELRRENENSCLSPRHSGARGARARNDKIESDSRTALDCFACARNDESSAIRDPYRGIEITPSSPEIPGA